MNKTDLINRIAEQAGLTKTQTTAALQAFETSVIDTLAAGDDVKLVGFGNFSVKDRPARAGRNPSTGEPLQIAASKAVVFKAGKPLIEAVS
jgi:DNA-binding protein HU-beta